MLLSLSLDLEAPFSSRCIALSRPILPLPVKITISIILPDQTWLSKSRVEISFELNELKFFFMYVDTMTKQWLYAENIYLDCSKSLLVAFIPIRHAQPTYWTQFLNLIFLWLQPIYHQKYESKFDIYIRIFKFENIFKNGSNN